MLQLAAIFLECTIFNRNWQLTQVHSLVQESLDQDIIMLTEPMLKEVV